MNVDDAKAASRARRPSRTRRGLRLAATVLLFAYFVLGIGFLCGRYWLMPRIDQWRPEVSAWLSRELGAPVRLGRLQADFDILSPRLQVDSADIGEHATGVHLGRAELVFSWRSVVARTPLFRLLRIDGLRFELVRQDAGHFQISGLPFEFGVAQSESRLVGWLLAQRTLRLNQLNVRYRDTRTQAGLELDDAALALDWRHRQHRLQISGAGRSLPLATTAPASTTGADAQDGAPAAPGIEKPAPLGPFELLAVLERRATGWGGQAYAEFEGVELASLGALLDRTASPAGGRAQGQVWLDLVAGRPSTAEAQLALEQPVLQMAEAGGRLEGLSAHVTAHWAKDGEVELTTSDLRLRAADGLVIDAARGVQELVFTRDWRLRQGRLGISSVRAEDLLRFARTLQLPPALAERIAPWQAAGRIDGASLDWRADRTDAPYRFAASFSDLVLEPVEAASKANWPALHGLSGAARIDRDGGRLELAGGQARLRLPGIFDDPEIALDRYTGGIRWRYTPEQRLAISIEHLEFENADAAGELRGSWEQTARGAGLVDFEGRLDRADATRVWRYLPLAVDAQVREWVRTAVRSGRSRDVRLRLRGDLLDFPFAQAGSGEFLVEATVEGGQLAYHPDWPRLDAVAGKLRFERSAMGVDGARARVGQVALTGVTAQIPDLSHAVLQVRGRGAGPLGDMLGFVRESPLREEAGEGLAFVRADGPAALVLELELPLAHLHESRVDGSVQLQGAELQLQGLPTMDELRGDVQFSHTGLRFDTVQGRWLGGELLTSGQAADGVFRMRGHGRAQGAALGEFIGAAAAPILRGEFAYDGELQLSRDTVRVAMHSTLQGLELALPAPVGKASPDIRPARLELAAEGTDPLHLRLRVDPGADTNAASVDFTTEFAAGSAGVARSALGVGVPVELPEAGFVVQASVPRLDFDAWRALAPAAAVGAADAPDWHGPDSVRLRVASGRLGEKTIEDLHVDAQRTGQSWTARVHSRQADGELQWHEPAAGTPGGTLVARFARLEIPESDRSDLGTLLADAPRSLPALDVRAEHLRIGAASLGALELRARHEGHDSSSAWLIDHLVLSQAAGRLEASGRWSAPVFADPDERSVALDLQLAITDAGDLLDALGFPGLLRGGSGTLGGALRWRGSPLAIDVPSLGGTLRLDIGPGQFLQVEPGLGKLVGVLNLQSLPRRLSLDFRDLFAQGFAFDSLRGDLALAAGIAHTDRLEMNGLAAHVRLQGNVDLAHETQDLVVVVEPQVDAGLAALAYAAMVNPAVGISTLVAQLLLRKPLGELLASELEITGPWREPQVVERRREAPVSAPTDPAVAQ